jgi:hypothetical protein
MWHRLHQSPHQRACYYGQDRRRNRSPAPLDPGHQRARALDAERHGASLISSSSLPVMNDDWRLQVELHEDGTAHWLTERLDAFDLAHALGTSFADRVIVSRDGSQVFCYAASREQAEAVRGAIASMAQEHGWRVEFELQRWHPAAEDWEEPEAPLPAGGDEAAAERTALMERERGESADQVYPEYEVRVRCATREAATALARRLRPEGLPTVQRGEFLVLGVADQDSAKALADRVRGEAPAGSEVVAEGSVPEVVSQAPFATPFNPFAVFGGLGG